MSSPGAFSSLDKPKLLPGRQVRDRNAGQLVTNRYELAIRRAARSCRVITGLRFEAVPFLAGYRISHVDIGGAPTSARSRYYLAISGQRQRKPARLPNTAHL